MSRNGIFPSTSFSIVKVITLGNSQFRISRVNRLNGDSSNISRGRPPTLDPRDAMKHAIQTSAVAQHATQCTGQLRAKVLCKERQFMIRKVKEALYIKFNSNINRDSGIAVRDSWTNIIRATNRLGHALQLDIRKDEIRGLINARSERRKNYAYGNEQIHGEKTS
ncbi:hypothetical protein M514_26489 [Trichuris suis]|uniref:Uncharacterized protein n=1 Tax=Trichuris suis TaxID=68888 RepID=A0A085MVW0_9BILA|nr:hypothetical protein M514_26489 [Trichuris suis]